ncbi:hypothetical protein U1Q18_001585 [Sarracenia purpurea var. burkii]
MTGDENQGFEFLFLGDFGAVILGIRAISPAKVFGFLCAGVAEVISKAIFVGASKSPETESGKDGGAEEPTERSTGKEGDDFGASGFFGVLDRRSQRKERRLAAWLAIDDSVALDGSD